ncbi:type IV pilin protein [Imhoffiella purpurea]|uniref:Type IV pilus biogenesis protein PilE n=1 Tax=Imhoffiella purpurea TaxID=1249627 RepID=W9VBD2_9GAMM|nr:type IV pilin protein [Imhoffiella purpurea]EXJ13327.1 Type IV pilus biogenesis protein PilE [Imhoffiella purpurea]
MPATTRRACLAFTLTELMIVLAILAILATIVIPDYQRQVRQARRTDGQTGLMAIALAQEKFRAYCSQYASRLEGARNCDAEAASPYALGLSETSPEGHYRFSLSGVSASRFTAEATGVGGQTHDRAGGTSCAELSLDQDGNRAPRDCW